MTSRRIPEYSRRQLGQWLRSRRKGARLTQMACSSALGISQSAWSKFENGIHEPVSTVLLRFAVLTKSDIKDLFV